MVDHWIGHGQENYGS